jgi:hypothetical protein
MTTTSSPPRVSRPRRLSSLLWLATMLLAAVVVSGNSMQARCPDQKAVAAVTAASVAPQVPAGRLLTASATTGVDLEVRILNVRIGFPWLKSLPVTPGRRIVVSLWETDADR